MTCDKCQGLIVDEHDEPRCINCGRRPGTPLRVMPASDEVETPEKCRSCARPPESGRKQCRVCLDLANARVQVANGKGSVTMPRFKTEEGKQRWLAAMAARRGKTRTEKTAGGGDPSTAVARVEPKILIPRPARVAVNGSAVEALEQAMADLDHDRATLARAKEILEARG